MNTTLKTRAAALVASILITFTTVDLVANYAHPAPEATVVASAAR